ncbi:MAG: hypothetical protein Q4C87_09900 [Actinomycetaceae bacterium]|nr:hypothetical protein [Actinomycetaceae bacterium]
MATRIHRYYPLLSVAIVAGLVGCGTIGAGDAPASPPASSPVTTQASGAQPPQATETIGHIKKDIATNALPTDPYVAPRLMVLHFQVRLKLIDKCLIAQGVQRDPGGFDADAPFAETSPTGISRIFNPAIAQKYGYRDAPDPTLGPPLTGTKESEPDPKLLAQCTEEATKTLRGDSTGRDLSQFDIDAPANLSGNEAARAAINQASVDTSAPPLREAAQRWKECMAPLGIVDLPDEPFSLIMGTLPQSLVDRWQWNSIGDPTDEEIRYAVHDAKCRDSSGWSQAFYDAEWDLHAHIVENYREEMDSIAVEVRDEEKRLRELLATTK